MPAGPAARTALRYELVTDAESFAVYAPGEGRELEPFIGQQVVARAKLIDLSSEGFGTELWIGSIGLVSTEPRTTD